MNRWLRILLLALCMALNVPTHALDSGRTRPDGLYGRDDKSQAAWTAHKDKSQAVLSNASDTASICSQRPERVNPTPSHLPTHHSVPRPHNLFYNQKTTFCHYRGCGIRLSRPLVDVPPCDYYVYRLRHLLC